MMLSEPAPDPKPALTGRAAQRERSRRRILDAASEVLTEGDDSRFTVREVAARAQVSPGLVMQHFGTMADLVLEVFSEANADIDLVLAKAADSADTARDKVISAFRRLTERDLSRPLLSGRMMAFAWTWGHDQEERFEPSWRALTERLKRILADSPGSPSVDACEAAATALIAIYNVNLRRAVTAGFDAQTAVERMLPGFDLVLAGLAAGAETEARADAGGAPGA